MASQCIGLDIIYVCMLWCYGVLLQTLLAGNLFIVNCQFALRLNKLLENIMGQKENKVPVVVSLGRPGFYPRVDQLCAYS